MRTTPLPQKSCDTVVVRLPTPISAACRRPRRAFSKRPMLLLEARNRSQLLLQHPLIIKLATRRPKNVCDTAPAASTLGHPTTGPRRDGWSPAQATTCGRCSTLSSIGGNYHPSVSPRCGAALAAQDPVKSLCARRHPSEHPACCSPSTDLQLPPRRAGPFVARILQDLLLLLRYPCRTRGS